MVVLAACSSSTAPAPITPAQLASDFDGLYSAHIAAGTPADSEAAALIAELFETAAAYGGNEATFTAVTASGSQTWHGVEIGAGESDGDTVFYTAVYPNRNLQQAMAALLETEDGVPVDSEAVATNTQWTTVVEDSVVTGATSTAASFGATCSLQTGLAAEAVIASFTGDASCTLAKYQTSFSAVFPAAAGLGALESVSVSSATFNGPFFVSTGSRVVGIPSKGSAMMARLHALLARH
jgi:hypothetical protein